MLMWAMSDRAIPRSYRTMQGFGVHTFRLVNAAGRIALRQVPLDADRRHALAGLGRSGQDLGRRSRLPSPRSVGGDRGGRLSRVRAGPADLHRGAGRRASRSTCSTRPRSCPRSSCRSSPVGKLVLNRNPDNFFAETEQVAFCTAHVVPGHRLHQRSAARGTDPLVRRHADLASRRAELSRDSDQRAGRAGAQQPARRHAPPGDQSRPGRPTSRTRSAAAARSRPARPASCRSRSRWQPDAHKVRGKAGAVRRSLHAGDAVLEQPDADREDAHHQRLPVRAVAGADAGGSRADGVGADERRAGAGREPSPTGSACARCRTPMPKVLQDRTSRRK